MHARQAVSIGPDLREWPTADLYGALDTVDDLIGPVAMAIAAEIDRRWTSAQAARWGDSAGVRITVIIR